MGQQSIFAVSAGPGDEKSGMRILALLIKPLIRHAVIFGLTGFVLLALLLGAITESGFSEAEAAGRKYIVVASIAPLADFARAVGGAGVRVETMTRGAQDPHSQPLLPSQIILLERAQLLVLNGLGLEPYGGKLREIARGLGLPVIIAGEGLGSPVVDPGAHGRSDGQSNTRDDSAKSTRRNPHVWLDPLLAVVQVTRIRDGLIRMNPQGQAGYRLRAQQYIDRVMELHRTIRETVALAKQRTFLVTHGAFSHFAKRYGLTQIAVMGTGEAMEPSPARIAFVISQARALGTDVIFTTPQLPPHAARVIAGEAGLRVMQLDPIGAKGKSYLQTMRANLSELALALNP